MSSTRARLAIVVLSLGVCACGIDIHPTVSPPLAQARMAELWEEPRDVAERDLLNGPWGATFAPDADDDYTYVRKKRHGANPGVTVLDSQQREWHIKQGV